MTANRQLIYEGSTKRIYRPAQAADHLWLEFIESSPDNTEAKANAIISAYFFEKLARQETWDQTALSPALIQFRLDWLEARWKHFLFSHSLSEHGAFTHFIGLINESGTFIDYAQAAQNSSQVYLEVLECQIKQPTKLSLIGQEVFFYSLKEQNSARTIVPIDIIFHLGLPVASQLQQRLNHDSTYAYQLGLEKTPQEGQFFERPVLEFCARFEPDKRILSLQEALLISGLTPGEFEEMIETSYHIALALHATYMQKNLTLWAGRLNYAVCKEGLLLIDSLEPNRMVLFYKDICLSGASIANIFHNTSKQLNELKIPSEGIAPLICNHLLDENIFVNIPKLEDF